MRDTDNSQDLIDIRDLIERFETLEKDRDEAEAEAMEGHAAWNFGQDERDEIAAIGDLLESFKGMGGDHQWRGDWYPVTLIRDSYFVEAMEEQVKDCGYIPADQPWWLVIDWDATAENMKADYTSAEYDGVTYWAR